MTKIHPLALVDEANCSALFALYGAPEFLAAFLGGAADGFAGFLGAMPYFLTDLLGPLANIMGRRTNRVARALGTVL